MDILRRPCKKKYGETTAFMEGFLAKKKKKSGLIPTPTFWRQRYFILDLDEKTLSYYESKPKPGAILSPKGVLKLSEVVAIQDAHLEKEGIDHCLELVESPSRRYYIGHSDGTVIKSWKESIEYVKRNAEFIQEVARFHDQSDSVSDCASSKEGLNSPEDELGSTMMSEISAQQGRRISVSAEVAQEMIAATRRKSSIFQRQAVRALHEAAAGGDADILDTLIRSGTEVNSTDVKGHTALHWAAGCGHLTCLEVLLHEHHAKVDAKNETGLTPLHLAAFQGNVDMVVALLLADADTDIADEDGLSAIHLAASDNRADVVEVLLKHGVNPNLAFSPYQRTCLHEAIRTESTEVVELLMTDPWRSDVEISLRNSDGESAADIAKKCSSAAIRRFFVVKEDSRPLTPQLEGKIIANEEILMDTDRVVGVGQYKDVFRGVWQPEGEEPTPVACLRLKQNMMASPVLFATFQREITFLHYMEHENVLKMYGLVRDDSSGRPVIVTELMDYSLYHVLHEKGRHFKIDDKKAIILGIARGVEYMHRSKIFHRDIKSLNVLLKKKPFRVVLADFGLSKVRTASHVCFHSRVGTEFWAAPEVLLNNPYDPEKADVYSVAMVFYEVLTNNVPYKNESTTLVDMQQEVGVSNNRPLLTPGSAPPVLVHLIERMWHENPKQRPSIGEVLKELEHPDTWFVRQSKPPGLAEAKLKQGQSPPWPMSKPQASPRVSS